MFELAPDSVKSVVNKSKSTQKNSHLETKTEIDNMDNLIELTMNRLILVDSIV